MSDYDYDWKYETRGRSFMHGVPIGTADMEEYRGVMDRQGRDVDQYWADTNEEIGSSYEPKHFSIPAPSRNSRRLDLKNNALRAATSKALRKR